eukprot:XP_015572106.1 dof zinc finger protein DOF1.4 isoform X2 [Ricinus communis]
MLGNCEKMVVISPTTNEWPQIDEKSLMVSSTSKLMEKRGQDPSQPQQQQQPQQALKCPRCDSSNTKFCYYNNYSLSQPRHFCKACKRYWTRGGTLRNVPVGGGCRKNKRVKRPSSSGGEGTINQVSSVNPNNPSSHQTPIDHITSTSNHINHLFYGLPTNPSEMNLPFGRFNSRVSSNMDTGYDLPPQLNALALGFSSGILGNNEANNGFNPTKHIQDSVTSTSLLTNYSSIFGCSSSSTATTSPSIATLLASSLHQQNKFSVKDSNRAPNHFQNLTPFEDLQMSCNSTESGIAMKEVKTEQGQSRLHWNMPCQNQIEQMGFSSSEPSLYWNPNTSSVGTWHDPANIGSSVTSLI